MPDKARVLTARTANKEVKTLEAPGVSDASDASPKNCENLTEIVSQMQAIDYQSLSSGLQFGD